MNLSPHRTTSTFRSHVARTVAAFTAFVACAAGAHAQTIPALSDLNRDAVTDSAIVQVGSGSSTTGTVEVHSGSGGALLYTVQGTQPGDGFGFALSAFDVTGDAWHELLVAAPRSGTPTGRVMVYNGPNGALVRTLTPPADVRIGLRIAPVADQDGDGVTDILVEGARLISGTWHGRAVLFSGASGRFLADRWAGFDSLLLFVSGGGRAYSSADLNDDGVVDSTDVLNLVINLGSFVPPFTAGDLNGNGEIDAADVQAMTLRMLAGERTVVVSASALKLKWGADPGAPARWSAMYGADAFAAAGLSGSSGGTGNGSGQGGSGGSGGSGSGSGNADHWIGLNNCECNPGGGGGSSVEFPGQTCWADIAGCPGRRLHIGDTFTLQGLGSGSVSGSCTWSMTGPDGVIAPNPDGLGGFIAVGTGCVTIRYTCTNTQCCSCQECMICVIAEQACDLQLRFVECPQEPVPAGSVVQLRVEIRPTPPVDRNELATFLAACNFRWHTDPADDHIIVATMPEDLENPPYLTLLIETSPEHGGEVTIAASISVNTPAGCNASDTCTFTVSIDSDGDGLPDEVEDDWETDPDNPDTDGDGFCDGAEDDAEGALSAAIPPADALLDSDRDGISDNNERRPLLPSPITNAAAFDTDSDGVHDLAEYSLGLSPLTATSIRWAFDRHDTNYAAADADQDGCDDQWERRIGLSPLSRDTDGDEIPDGVELAWGTDPLTSHRDESIDADDDGLCDFEEVNFYGSDPMRVDSDFDGLEDGYEVRAGLSPVSVYSRRDYATGERIFDPDGDLDFDGLSNADEYAYGSEPLLPDTDGDGVLDGDEVENGSDPTWGGDAGQAPPSDGQGGREGMCKIRFTVGCHLSENCRGRDTTTDPNDWLDDGRSGSNPDNKRQHTWEMSVTYTDANGREVTRRVRTGAFNSRNSEDFWLPRGACATLRLNLRATATPNYIHYFAGAVPVDPETGLACESCCCLLLHDLIAGTDDPPMMGNHCELTSNAAEGREVLLCLPLVDLDIDSDNSNGLYGAPQRDLIEERLERGDLPGGMKVVIVNREDSDNDGILDSCDGFDLDGLPNQNDQSEGSRFVPVVLKVAGIPAGLRATTTVRFAYNAASLADAVLTPRTWQGVDGSTMTVLDHDAGPGLLRLWHRDGGEMRTATDWIDPSSDYPLNDILGSAASTVTLYVEAVNGSALATPISALLQLPGLSTCTNSSSTARLLPLDPLTGVGETSVAGYTIIRADTSEVYGSPGRDIILGQNNEPGAVETIWGLSGDDIILPGGGEDVIHTGSGSDLVFSWRGIKDIHIDLLHDRISYMAGNVLGAAPLTNIQVEPPQTTPEPEPAAEPRSSVPFTAADVRRAYVWAFGANDPFLRAFEDPNIGRGQIHAVPSLSSWRPSLLTRGTWDFERIHVSGSGDSVVNRYVFKVEYDAESPLDAAVSMRNAILKEMRQYDFSAFFLGLTLSERTDGAEWDVVYQSWNEMRTAQLQNVTHITLALTKVYMSAWLSAAGPVGELIDAVMSIPDAAGLVAEAAKAGLDLLSRLPGKFHDPARTEAQGGFLDGVLLADGTLQPTDPPDQLLDPPNEEEPPSVAPRNLFALLEIPAQHGNDVEKLLDVSEDVARVRFAQTPGMRVGFVLRKGMDAVPVLTDNGMVLKLGRAQTVAGDIANLHVRTIERIVAEMIEHGRPLALAEQMPTRRYLYVAQNRSLRTVVADAENGARFASCSRRRPDIIGVWINDQGQIGVDMFEVRSLNQQLEELDSSLVQVMDTLPDGVLHGNHRAFPRDAP